MKNRSGFEPTAKAENFFSGGYDFSDDPKARALLKMPGCYSVFANKSHSGSFRIPISIISGKTEMLKALKEQSRFWSKRKIDGNAYCYCYPTEAIISLVWRHCVFERSFKALKRKTRKWHEDIGAFKLTQNNKQRTYQLYRVKCRRLKRFGVDYLEVVYFKLSGLIVTVETLATATNGAAMTLKATTELNGNKFIAAISAEVNGEAGYNAVYSAFASTMSALSSNRCSIATAKKEILNKIKAESDLIDYEAVHGFVNGIFGYVADSPAKTKTKTKSEVLSDLRKIQARLFDASVVVDSVMKAISERMGNWLMVERL
jgi:hypothetical protein